MIETIKYIKIVSLLLICNLFFSQSLDDFIQRSDNFTENEDYTSALNELNLANKVCNNEYERALVYSRKGYLFHIQNKTKEALENYLFSELKFKESDTLNENFAQMLSSISILYENNKELDISENYLIRAISIYENIGVLPETYSFLISSLADIYFKQKDFGVAEPLYIQALQIIEKNRLSHDENYLNILIRLGAIYTQSKDFKLAEQVLVEAYDFRTLLSIKQQFVLYFGLGAIEENNGYYINAAKFFQEALNSIKSLEFKDTSKQETIYKLAYNNYKSNNHKAAEGILNDLIYQFEKYQIDNEIKVKSYLLKANIFQFNGDLKQVLSFIQKSKNIIAKLSYTSNESIAEIHNEIGVLYFNLGKVIDAKKEYEKASDIYTLLQVNKYYFSEVIINLSKTYLELGELDAAENLLYPLLEDFEEENKLQMKYVVLLQTLGDIYIEKSQYQKAEILLLESGEILELISGKQSFEYALFLNRIGGFYYAIGDFERAALSLINSLEITEKTKTIKSIEYATALNNLALLFIDIEDYEEAISKLKQSCAIEKEMLGSSHYSYATSLHNLGNTFFKNNETDSALIHFNKALNIFKSSFGENNINYNRSLAKICEVKFFQNTLNSQTIFQLENAIKIFEKTYGSQNLETIHYQVLLANIYQKNKNVETAFNLLQKAINALDNNKTLFNSFFSESEKQKYFNKIQPYYDQFYSFLIANNELNPKYREVLYNQVLKDKGLLLESSLEIRKKVTQSNNDEIKYLYSSLIAINKQIGENLSIPEENRTESIEELKNKSRNIEKELLTYLNVEKPTYDWKKLKLKLKEDEAIIEYLSFQDNEIQKLYGLIITPNSSHPKIVYLCESKPIEELLGIGNIDLGVIEKAYGNLSNPNETLYNSIWMPTDTILSKFKTIYYSPNGILNRIAFHAIRNPKGEYLIQKHKLIQLYSSRSVLGDMAYNLTPNSNVLLFGGIAYDDLNEEGIGWSYLSGTKNEVNSLKSILKNKYNTTFFVDKEASEENFKSLAHNQQIIHLATHGFFFPDPKIIAKEVMFSTKEVETIEFRGTKATKSNSFVSSENPMIRSGLVLARANNLWSESKITYREDGLLTAYEVANLDLNQTELVVLSACETGLGDIAGNEGVYGLQRAFKLAGSKNIIITLWQIPDKESDEFMQLFYTHLLKTKSIREAFYTTQMEFSEGKPPYYWGAFTLVE